MKLRTLVLREIFERESQRLTSVLAILLGITVSVSRRGWRATCD